MRERISEGVTGAVVILMPKGWSASSTALAMAAGVRWRCLPPDYDWDRQMLERLVAGRGAETATLSGGELDKAGQRGVPHVDHPARRRGRSEGPRDLLRALLAPRQCRGDVARAVTLHYRFPPAAGYPLNRCLYRLKSDHAFRDRYLADPEATLQEAGLDPERIAALRSPDRDRLLAMGAHAYLVFMAALRPKMASASQTFERF